MLEQCPKPGRLSVTHGIRKRTMSAHYLLMSRRYRKVSTSRAHGRIDTQSYLMHLGGVRLKDWLEGDFTTTSSAYDMEPEDPEGGQFKAASAPHVDWFADTGVSRVTDFHHNITLRFRVHASRRLDQSRIQVFGSLLHPQSERRHCFRLSSSGVAAVCCSPCRPASSALR